MACRAPGQRYQAGRAGAAGLAAGLALLLAPAAADAQYYYRQNYGLFGTNYYGSNYYGSTYYGSPYWARPRPAAPADPYYFKPQRKPRDTAKESVKDSKGTKESKKEPKVKPAPAAAGPLLIAVSLNSQRLTLYSKGTAIAHAPVSTGTDSHPTPTGIFSVIGKEKFHRSNLYSNAPMPFMQRITWSGVALHQGVLPGYPASHGCIRLPNQFSQYLWGTTRIGARVIITRAETVPFEIAHPKLFAPKPEEEPAMAGDGSARATKIAETDHPVTSSDAPKPVATPPAAAGESQAGKATGPLAGPSGHKPQAGPGSGGGRGGREAAAELSDIIDVRLPSPTATDSTRTGAAADNTDRGGRAAGQELKDTPRMSEPVSVFISRKTGRLYVRQGFEPLFDVPVTIRDPEAPLGTHLYVATDLKEDRRAMAWIAVNLAGAPASEPEHRRGDRKARQEREHTPSAPASLRHAATAALDRVDMPQEAVDRISDLLSPGASLIISDYPLSAETGKYTDFIILTK